MQMTLKLFASLSPHLPAGAARNEAQIDVADGTTIWQVLDAHNVPRASCHLVLLNGHFQAPAVRDTVQIKPGDALAVWPPVAGG